MHTPGPWKVNADGRVGAHMPSHPVIAFVRGYPGSTEAEANARLIAAAPALFEALDALLRMVDEQSDDGMFQSAETVMAREALGLAEGEQK